MAWSLSGVDGAKTIDWQATKKLRLQRKSAVIKAASSAEEARQEGITE